MSAQDFRAQPPPGVAATLAFGTLPAGIDAAAIIKRHTPEVP